MRMRSLALLATLLLPLPLLAQTYDYTYTGNDFNYYDVSGPYTTSDFVTVSFTLSAPLGPDLTGNSSNGGFGPEITPLTWSMSDGVQTDTSADPSAKIEAFNFITNSSGTIVDWSVSIEFGAPACCWIGTIYEPQVSSGYISDYGSNGLGGGHDALDPGSWSVSESSVPEGSSFPLLLLSGACLFGVGFFRLYRRQS